MEELDLNDILSVEEINEDDIASVEEPSILPDISGVVDTAKSIGGSAVDLSRGVAEGMLGGGLGEVTGGLSGLAQYGVDKLTDLIPDPTNKALEAQGFNIQEQDKGLGQYLREGIDTAESKISQSKEDSPILTGGGQLAGAVATGMMIPGLGGGTAAKGAKGVLDILKDQGKMKAGIELLKRGVTGYTKMTPIMAVEGMLGSEGKLLEGTSEEQKQVLGDVGSNLAFGIPAAMGLTAASELVGPLAKQGANKVGGKVKEFIEDRPFLRQVKKSFEYGKEGINPVAEKNVLNTELGKTSLAEIDNTRTSKLMGEILDTDTKLGQLVGKSLEEAEAVGKVIDITRPVNNAAKSLQASYEMFEDIANNSRGSKIYSRIANRTGENVTPLEAKSLLNDIDAFVGRFEGSRNRTSAEEAILNNLRKLRVDLSNTIKTEIPAYKSAASRFEEFRRLVPETIMSGSTPREISDVYMGNLKNVEKQLHNYLGKLVKSSTSSGSSNIGTKTAFVNSIKGMKKFEESELERLMKGEIKDLSMKRKATDYEKMIKNYADDAQARRAAETVEERTSAYKNIAASVLDTGESGRAKILAASNMAGKANKFIADKINSPISKGAKKLMLLSPEKMLQYADRLDEIGLGHLGQALRTGVQAGDQQKIRAAMFVISQNPNARNSMEGE
jgi:hypothetical protein